MEKKLEDILSYSGYQKRVVFNQQVIEAAKQNDLINIDKQLTNDGIISDEQKIDFFEKYGLPTYSSQDADVLEENKQILKSHFFALIETQQKLLESNAEDPQKYLTEALNLSAYLTLIVEEAEALQALVQVHANK